MPGDWRLGAPFSWKGERGEKGGKKGKKGREEKKKKKMSVELRLFCWLLPSTYTVVVELVPAIVVVDAVVTLAKRSVSNPDIIFYLPCFAQGCASVGCCCLKTALCR